jgi:Ulp1 family protease
MDLKKCQIEYYDSYGSAPEELIYKFMYGFAEKLDKYYGGNKKIVLDFSRVRHQYGGSECGMFSMVFLIQRLQGYSIKDIEKQKITDKFVNDLRFVMFR